MHTVKLTATIVKLLRHLAQTTQVGSVNTLLESEPLPGVVWSMKFSKDGKYLASAGQDMVVHVWEVLQRSGQPPDGASSASDAESTQPGPFPLPLLIFNLNLKFLLHLSSPPPAPKGEVAGVSFLLLLCLFTSHHVQGFEAFSQY